MSRSDVEIENYALLSQEERGAANSVSPDSDKPACKSTIWQSVSNLVSDVEGTGILALPFVIQIGGLFAIAALAIVPWICYYTGKILVECLYVKNEDNEKVRIRSNYKDLAAACWPRYGVGMVVIVQLFELLLLASLYLVLSGSLLHGMLPDCPVPERVWMLISATIGLPTLFIKHLSNVAWISLISVITLTISILIILSYGAWKSPNWTISSIPLWNTEGVPIALAIITFSYICHPVLPMIESNMKNPKQFNTMLALTYVSVFISKTVFALFGFLTFNPNIQQVITNSISSHTVLIVVNSFLVINVLTSYPFRILSLIDCLEDSILDDSIQSKFNEVTWYVSVRIVVSFLTLLPALLIPHFALMISFVGSLTGMLVAIVFPCAFHLHLQYRELTWYSKLFDYIIIVFGVITGLIGSIISAIAIGEAFN